MVLAPGFVLPITGHHSVVYDFNELQRHIVLSNGDFESITERKTNQKQYEILKVFELNKISHSMFISLQAISLKN